jgi:hypothetical protein
MSPLRSELFRLPKAGSTPAEYEDGAARSSHHGRFAVADGASASAFARLWAHLLVRAYAAGRLSHPSLESDLQAVQSRWAANVDTRPLPWYAAEQARRGAFAALLGLSLECSGAWTALSVGDCCLFQLRGAALQVAFPLCDPEAFDNRPFLIGSRPASNLRLRDCGAILQLHGTWQPGDTFLLMSDALAAAFLRLCLRSTDVLPLTMLDFAHTASGFRRWIHALRTERMLRNDDVTLLWVSVDGYASA